MFGKSAGIAAAAAAALLMAAPASAQKSKDTIRIAITDMFSVLDPYYFPLDEAGQFYRSVYETLVAFDERKQHFVPRLAKSWKRIDPKTIEFELRDDVKFHNGNKFTSEDVAHTINYLKDPKVKIRFKGRYNWVDRVETLGDYRVRIISKKAFSTDLSTIAYRFFMYDAETHKALKNKSAYGRETPYATGPYKVDSIDPHKGLFLTRYENYYDKSGNYPAPVKHVVGVPIADRQTQLAQFFTGGIDIMRNVTADMARELARQPNAAVTAVHSGMLMYLTLDAAGRSDNKVMKDVRVRKAVMMAIDRKTLAKTVVPGGDSAELVNGICFKELVGCSLSTTPPAYDPAGARKLLAEAGFAGGMPLELMVHAPIKEVGEAIAGQLRKVGIRASIRPLPLSLYVKLRAQGKFTAFNGFYPTSTHPDVANILNFFFSGTRDYWKDPLIKEAQRKGALEYDIKKREAIYRPALDRVNEMAYIYPVGELPTVFVHTKDIEIRPNPLSALESRLGDFAFK